MDFLFRTDVAFCIILPSSVDGMWTLKSETIRFCLNDVCHRTISKSKLKNKLFHPMKELDISFLSVRNRRTVTEVYDGKNVKIKSWTELDDFITWYYLTFNYETLVLNKMCSSRSESMNLYLISTSVPLPNARLRLSWAFCKLFCKSGSWDLGSRTLF